MRYMNTVTHIKTRTIFEWNNFFTIEPNDLNLFEKVERLD